MEGIIFLIVVIGIVYIVLFIFKIKTYYQVYENSRKLNAIIDLLSSTKPKPEKQKEVLPKKQIVTYAEKLPQKEIIVPEKTPSEPDSVVPSEPPKPKSKPVQMRKVLIPKPKPIETSSELENKVQSILKSIWNWIIVGEEHRNKNLSLEYAIATTWLLRTAILFIVIGIGFLLKYSIDNSWVGPTGRVCMSFLAGIIMLISGLKLLKGKYRVIGQGLLGGSIAVFYFSAYAGSMMYNLMPVTYAFAIMILVTIATGMLAVKLDSLLVAILGTIGGYLTPIMLSTGSGNIPVLFTYMLILGIGVLGIAKYKRYKLLNALSFIFTYVIFFSVLIFSYNKSIHFNTVILFATLYFLMFFGINILYNLVNKEISTVLELIGMFANSVIYFLTSFIIISDLYSKEYVAIVTLGLAAFYSLGMVCVIKRKIDDKPLKIFLTGFAAFFVTITIPLLLTNEWLTSAWAIQAIIFLWMSSKLKNKFLRSISYLIYFITFIKILSVDFAGNFIGVTTVNYSSELTSRLLTFGMLIVSTGLGYFILKKENDEDSKNNAPAPLFMWAVSVFAFIYFHFEFFFFADEFYKPIIAPLTSLIWVGAILLILRKLSTQKYVFKFFLMFLFFGLVCKLFFVDSFLPENFIYQPSYYGEQFFMRLLDFVLIFGVISYSYFVSAKNNFSAKSIFAISALGLLFLYSTFELNTFLKNSLPAFQSGGISILWALFAITFIFSGIKTKLRSLRFAGLFLFVVCAIKVFFSDLSQLSSLYKIFASIAFGIVILAGAFIYVKFVETFSTSDKKM